MTRLSRTWQALTLEQRIAAGGSVALLVTMLLPWYQQNAVVTTERAAPLQSRNLNAFQVFSFIEAAVLLVALAVGYLLYARANGRDFRLPGSDGTMVFLAGIWAAGLLVLRLFDKPGISGRGVAGNVGVQWGIFFALAAAGALVYAGSRMRAAQLHPHAHHHLHLRHEREHSAGGTWPSAEPEPLTPAGTFAPAARPATAAGAGARRTPVRAERGGAHVASEAPTAPVPGEPEPQVRPRYPPAPSRQMSFEDAPREREPGDARGPRRS